MHGEYNVKKLSVSCLLYGKLQHYRLRNKMKLNIRINCHSQKIRLSNPHSIACCGGNVIFKFRKELNFSNHTTLSPRQCALLFSDILYSNSCKSIKHVSIPRGIIIIIFSIICTKEPYLSTCTFIKSIFFFFNLTACYTIYLSHGCVWFRSLWWQWIYLLHSSICTTVTNITSRPLPTTFFLSHINNPTVRSYSQLLTA
jgi:hypothetical protein